MLVLWWGWYGKKRPSHKCLDKTQRVYGLEGKSPCRMWHLPQGHLQVEPSKRYGLNSLETSLRYEDIRWQLQETIVMNIREREFVLMSPGSTACRHDEVFSGQWGGKPARPVCSWGRLHAAVEYLCSGNFVTGEITSPFWVSFSSMHKNGDPNNSYSKGWLWSQSKIMGVL